MAQSGEGGFLTTHVLDLARGRPADGVRVELYSILGDEHRKLTETLTNSDGRTEEPILPTDRFSTGTYELIFFAGKYLSSKGLADEGSLFLDQIPIRFSMREARHYHVPLLLSPYGYSTYRGS